MDELNVFRGFRSGVAGPTEAAERRASARLGRAIEGGSGVRAARLTRRRLGHIALAFAVLVGAAVATLFVSAPWKSSPGFLERAQAALTPPAGTVLHVKSDMTSTWPGASACTFTHAPSEVWIDQTPPYRYRAILSQPDPNVDPRDAVCSEGAVAELGGTLDSKQTLTFVPPNRLVSSRQRVMFPVDPVEDLRGAIAAGWAHHDGKTELEGRTVERIRLDIPLNCPDPPCEPSYAYVDPETFYPLQFEGLHGAILQGDGSVRRFHIVERYLTYEYLPRTSANLALTDIRAQHPDATGP
jgi:hypothetical protein